MAAASASAGYPDDVRRYVEAAVARVQQIQRRREASTRRIEEEEHALAEFVSRFHDNAHYAREITKKTRGLVHDRNVHRKLDGELQKRIELVYKLVEEVQKAGRLRRIDRAMLNPKYAQSHVERRWEEEENKAILDAM